MKRLIAMLALVLAYQAQAQNGQGNLQGDGAVIVPVQSAQPVQETQANPQSASGNQIYILNNQRQQGYQGQGASQGQGVGQNQGQNQGQNLAQIQEQPISVVQEAPLKVSQSEIVRKRRQSEESNTEDGIVQALERARMDDELKRRDKFNNAIGANQNAGSTIVGDNNSVQQTQVIQQPAVQVQQPVQQIVPPVIAKPKQKVLVLEDEADDIEEVEHVNVRSEIRAALKDAAKKPEEKQSYYVGGAAVFGNYDNVINVNRSMGWGVVIGTQTTDRVIAEGSFTMGDYELEDVYNGMTPMGYVPMLVDMRQMNFGVAAKYVVLPGKFRPSAGAALSYTRRTYSYGDYDFRTSDALDVAGVVGADLQVSDGFSIGVDFRYYTNLGYRQNTNRRESFVFSQQRNDPEKLDYYTVNLMGKFTF